jgi:4-amino-4-deoxy-L-arabinose transferase-like glycosyltransferase
MNLETVKSLSKDSLLTSTTRRPLVLHGIAIFLLAVLVTGLFWAILPARFLQNESTDYLYYYEPVARNLLKGAGFVRSDHALAINNPPGYPLLLAGIFSLAKVSGLSESSVHSTFVLLCMGLSATFVFLLSQSIWGTGGGWLSALFFMTYPFSLWLTKQPSTEVPFMTALYASLYLFWLGLKGHRQAWMFMLLAGAFMGAAMLVRAIAVGAGILLCVLVLLLRKDLPARMRGLFVSALLVGNILVVLPWQGWAYEKTGQVILLGTNGIPSVKDGLTFAVEAKTYRQDIPVTAEVARLQQEIARENDLMTSWHSISVVLGKHLLADPRAVVQLFLIKAGRSWYGTDSGSMETPILFIQSLYGALVALSTIAIWRRRFQYPELLLFVWGFVFYFWLMTILALSILRYMTPTVGLLSLLVPELAHRLAQRFIVRSPD